MSEVIVTLHQDTTLANRKQGRMAQLEKTAAYAESSTPPTQEGIVTAACSTKSNHMFGIAPEAHELPVSHPALQPSLRSPESRTVRYGYTCTSANRKSSNQVGSEINPRHPTKPRANTTRQILLCTELSCYRAGHLHWGFDSTNSAHN